MADYLLLMHNDTEVAEMVDWGPYLERLRGLGALAGGSAMGAGICVRKCQPVPEISARLTGFIRVVADDLEQVRELLVGNPVYEAGGTVEIRELPVTG